MKKSLCLVACLLFAPLCANAGPMYLQLTESDPGGPNDVMLSTYDSLVDMVNFNAASTFSLSGLASNVSVRGLAFDGDQYVLWTESDPGGANVIELTTYNSFADLVSLNAASSFTPGGPPSAVSVSGLAYDGNQYLLWTESDPGGLNNIVLNVYDSLTDLANLNSAGSFFPGGPPSAVSVRGLAHDGSQYLLWTESDPGGLNNVVLNAYDTLVDLANLNSAGSFFPGGLDPEVSVSGITFVPEQAIDVPEPWSLGLFGLSLVGLALARRRCVVR